MHFIQVSHINLNRYDLEYIEDAIGTLLNQNSLCIKNISNKLVICPDIADEKDSAIHEKVDVITNA